MAYLVQLVQAIGDLLAALRWLAAQRELRDPIVLLRREVTY